MVKASRLIASADIARDMVPKFRAHGQRGHEGAQGLGVIRCARFFSAMPLDRGRTIGGITSARARADFLSSRAVGNENDDIIALAPGA